MKENVIEAARTPQTGKPLTRGGRLAFIDNRPHKTWEEGMITAIQRSVGGIIQMAKFELGGVEYDSGTFTLETVKQLIRILAEGVAREGVDFCVANNSAVLALKNWLKKSKEPEANELHTILSSIQRGEIPQAAEDVPIPVIESVQSEEPVIPLPIEEQQGILIAHPYHALVTRIGVLSSPNIDRHLSKPVLLPENVRSEIAEYMTADVIHTAKPTAIILTGLRVVQINPGDIIHPTTDKAEIDNMVVVKETKGYIPVEIIETKAGEEGKHKGKIITQLSNKVKALQAVKDNNWRIRDKMDKDITDDFDLDALSETRPNLYTSGEMGAHHIHISTEHIDGVLSYLRLMHSLKHPQLKYV